MLVKFKDLPKTTRVWIYQSDREFSVEEVTKINSILENFIDGWNNHGDGLKGSCLVKYNLFIVLAIDEAHKEASGCSIDSSVQTIKKIEKEFDVNLFNRMQTAFKDGDNINIVSMLDFQKYVKESKINSETIVFNNMIDTIDGFENNWEVTADKSWHARFLL
ncbi:MAG: ABC transporter ATPase [Flavobacteriaceae bacterium]